MEDTVSYFSKKKTAFCLLCCQTFCLSIPVANSVWVTGHCKMPKLERAFKWREIEYARLTLTDLANVKQLSWATRATIIIGEAHFQVAVERGDILKKDVSSTFYVLLESIILKIFCTSVFIMIDITLIFQIPWITLGKISAHTLDAAEKNVHNTILSVFELSLSCQSTVMLTIDSCANVSTPRMAVRVYKTHFSLCENDRMQWVKTTKLSQTAVCADNYQIYLLTTIGQNHFMKSIVWRQGHPLLLDRMDNYDNRPHTYTDGMLSITSSLKGCRLMAEKFFEALVHYLSPSSKRKELPVKSP